MKQCSTKDGRASWDRHAKTQVGTPATLTSVRVKDRASAVIPKECPAGEGLQPQPPCTIWLYHSDEAFLRMVQLRNDWIPPCWAESEKITGACVIIAQRGLMSRRYTMG